MLDAYQQDGYRPRREASTNGGEYSGPCPFCGGEDRFRIWPEAGRYWCRRCERKGDLLRYLNEVRGWSINDPRKKYRTVKQPTAKRQGLDLAPPEKSPQIADLEAWRAHVNALGHWACTNLINERGRKEREFLHSRGLNDQTISKYGLGVIPFDYWRGREPWGLSPIIKKNGMPTKLWLPGGILVPTFDHGQPVQIKIRRWQGKPRYYALPGSNGAQLIAGQGSMPVVVESELDALLLAQEAGGSITAIALGSAQNKPSGRAAQLIADAQKVLVALDSDEAGAKAYWQWWRRNVRQSKRWPVPAQYGKDPTEAYQAGMNIRNWLEEGLTTKKG